MNNPLINPGLGVFFWMLLAFAILVFILAKFGWPIILKSLDKRERSIRESLQAADRAREDMKQLKANNEEILRQAKIERDEIMLRARDASDRIVEEARLKATQEADRIVENARENIEYEKLKAMHDLKNQVANLSIEIAEKLLRSELSDKERAESFVREEIERANF